MQKKIFIEVVNESVIEKGFNKSKNEEFPKFDCISILDWGWIFNKYSSIILLTDVPLKRLEILNKLYYCFNLVKNSGIIGNFSVEPSGVCECSDRSEYIETSEGDVRYIRLLLKYDS